VYLDGGPCADNVPSTIVDLTGSMPRVLRAGAVTADQLRKVVPLIDLEPYIHTDKDEPETAQQEAQLTEQDVKPAEPHPMDGGAEETES
jgi:hypothetical protein